MRLLLALTFLISSQAFAQAPSVNITSFTYTNQERKLAELCGIVTNMNKLPTYIQVIVDHDSSRPANYNTLVGADGKFCLALISYRGTAKAIVWE
jgi:P pilus assembly chaperone PapD